MKNLKQIYIPIIAILSFLQTIAQPTPPNGKKWEKIEALSDEFEENSLNTNKWTTYNPSWVGRPPGLFKPNTISVNGGLLKIKNYLLDSPVTVNGKKFTHGCGFIGSKEANVYGYFECRMKASKTFMSSTFWLINTKNNGTGCDRRVTELDITETVGVKSGNKDWINGVITGMNSNSHSRKTSCNSTPEGTKGGKRSLGEESWKSYHTYGVWWKNKNELLFYLDGKFAYKVTPPADFNLPMYLRMVTETYDWNPTPGDGGMTGSADSRTTFYDWVHTYKLVDNDNSNPNPNPNPCNETKAATLSEDAYLQETTRFNSNELRIESGKRVSYLKFTIPSVTQDVTSAKLELTVSGDAGNGLIEIFKGSSNNWTEINLSSSNKPTEGIKIGSLTTNYNIGESYQWDLLGITPGETISLVVKQTGGNDVSFSSKEGSSAPKLVLKLKCDEDNSMFLSNKDKNIDSKTSSGFKMYPNPAKNVITVSGEKLGASIIIHNIFGQILKKYILKNRNQKESLDISSLNSGVYFISIPGRGKMKFIKE